VYALLIAAFIPSREVGPFNLQGLVLFALYAAGVASALIVGLVMNRLTRGPRYHPLMLELPDYQWPNLRNLAFGLVERAQIFLARVGGIILALMVLLWFLSSFPAPPPGAAGPAIEYSFAGRLGHALALLLAPIGFNWQISIALIPGMAAREVAVGSLGTIYAISGGEEATDKIAQALSSQWSLATALAFLAWYVFAPQCASTLAVIRRETGGWRWLWVTFFYMLALAYVAAFLTYRIAIAFGGG
jgi:ferrous iron transport protein B